MNDDDDDDVMMDVVNGNENDLMKMNNYCYLLNVMVEALNDDENYDDHHH